MEVRDPVHGSIAILDEEIPVISSSFFQRLRNIKQLGFSEYSFPGATHTRYIHSIGVMSIATKAFDKIFYDERNNKEFQKLKETLRMGCLLHDIGHAPLSHSTESVMPMLSELKLQERFLTEEEKKSDRQATHEDYTIKIITDSSLTPSFSQITKSFGVTPASIAELVIGETTDPDYFTVNSTNYFPLLHQLVSSEMDCDRMDYLLRDSYFCGVSYGKYDLDWIIDNLNPCLIDGQAFLGLHERAIATFDDFLLGRFHMFLMVYFHYRAVCLEKLLGNYFKTSKGEYKIPSNIDEYLEHDDYHLKKVLRRSSNPWAKRVVQNNIPKKIFESFGQGQLAIFNKLEEFLKSSGIEYIKCSSTGRLSKYYDTSQDEIAKFPMKVYRTHHGSSKMSYFNINDATDLFEKFSSAHSVNRLHCDIESLSESTRNAIYSIISSEA